MRPDVLKVNFTRKIKDFSAYAEDEIFFPKNTYKSVLLRYFFGILFALFALSLSLLLKNADGKIVSFSLFFLAIVLSAVVGGFGVGSMISIIAGVSIFLMFYPINAIDVISLFEFGIFILIGSLVSLLIASAKRIDLANKFSKKEREYLKQIKVLEEEAVNAKEEIKVRDEFISIASHELKTPLTTTLLKLQTALHNVRNVSLANFSVQNLLSMLESAEHQTQRLSKMINDLLNVSLIRTGRLELELEETDLTSIAKDVKERFAERIEKEGVSVKFEAKEEIKGKFDKLRIEQVLTNLISNALKYGDGKPIEIKVKKENSHANIIIHDNGIGIPSSQRNKIFELFERGNHATSYKGLGVGLYITNKIVNAHKGKILVDSNEGKGSTFTVELPLKH